MRECTLDWCHEKYFSTGFCSYHYDQNRRGKEFTQRPPFGQHQTQVDGDGRVCTKCLKWQNWSNFTKSRKRLTGYSAECRECKKFRTRNNRIGWTHEMVEVVLDIQQGICAISGCNNPATDADHCHETGEPRAMLCSPCNKSLGLMKEDPERIRGLAEYAEQCVNVRMWAII